MKFSVPHLSRVFLDTPAGLALLAASGKGVCFLQFGPDQVTLETMLYREFMPDTTSDAAAPATWNDALRACIDGTPADIDAIPLDLRGTDLQLTVWRHIRQIPHGQTRSYRQLALDAGRPAAVRAVASACGANRIALLVPCHRVLRSDGGLGGYRWGLELKSSLLAREAASTDR